MGAFRIVCLVVTVANFGVAHAISAHAFSGSADASKTRYLAIELGSVAGIISSIILTLALPTARSDPGAIAALAVFMSIALNLQHFARGSSRVRSYFTSRFTQALLWPIGLVALWYTKGLTTDAVLLWLAMTFAIACLPLLSRLDSHAVATGRKWLLQTGARLQPALLSRFLVTEGYLGLLAMAVKPDQFARFSIAASVATICTMPGGVVAMTAPSLLGRFSELTVVRGTLASSMLLVPLSALGVWTFLEPWFPESARPSLTLLGILCCATAFDSAAASGFAVLALRRSPRAIRAPLPAALIVASAIGVAAVTGSLVAVAAMSAFGALITLGLLWNGLQSHRGVRS